MDVENGIFLEFILGSDNRIVKRVRNNSVISRQDAVLVIFVFFLRIWLHFVGHLLCLHLLLHVLCKLHFDQKRALGTILPVAIQNCKEMLMKFLTHVWGQDKVVLVLFVGVADTKSFSRGVRKSRYNIGLNDLGSLALLILFYSER